MPLDKTPWTDDTLMPWGAHESKRLGDVPPSYLLWLFERPWIKDWPGLYSYLKENEDALLQEKAEQDAAHPDDFESYGDYEDYMRQR